MKKNYFKKCLLLGALNFLVLTFVHAQVPDYYNGTDITATGEDLKTNLSTLITNTHTTELSYTPGVWDALKQTDLDPTNSNNVLLIYGYDDTDSDLTNDRSRSKDSNGGNTGDWNREHTYPKSLGNPNLGESGPGSDAHHLRASDVQFNSTRSNNPYIDDSGVAKAINSGFYPGDEWKGDVARMMMYMYVRYGDRCLPNTVGLGDSTYSSDMRDIFLEWNAEDPVSQVEINRNILLEGIQGNRNPFIDNPAFATTIWGGPQAENRFETTSTDTEAPTAPESLVIANTTDTETVLSWDASTDNVGVIAYQIFQDGTQIASSTETTYTVTDLIADTEYTFYVVAIDASSNTSGNSNEESVTTLEATDIPATGDYIVFQGYESSIEDTWAYTQSPVACADGTDIWDVVTSVGSITTPNSGINFFGIQDLEGNCGTADGGTLAFNSVDVSTFEDVTLSFSVNVDGFDVANGDVITYEILHDGVSQGIVTITVDSPYSTSGWEKITASVPNTVSSVALNLYVKQNGGSDYAGFDDVLLQGTSVAAGSSDEGLLINEVDADQDSTDASEFIELFDGGAGNTSLDGYVVVLYNGSSDVSYDAIDLDGYTTDENGYFVIGSESVANVDLIEFTTNGIQNGADAVALYLGDVTSFSTGTAVLADDTLIDALVYGTSDADDEGLLVLLNSGEIQVDENEDGNGTLNSMQRSPNGSGGLKSTSAYAMSTPTPGAENLSTTTVEDNEVPTTPENIVTSNITGSSVDLSWDASTDNVAVTEYQIYNGTELVATTTETSITIENLEAVTAYSFTVIAVDATGNISESSDGIEFTTTTVTINSESALLITALYDGPLTGGVPKGVELYVTEDIDDLSVYGLGSANNGGGTDGEEFTFDAVAVTAGTFIYVASESVEFANFFGFEPTYTSGAMAINGDDAVELFMDGVVVDVFGEIDVDGSGQAWEYTDGWAYRVENTVPDTAFAIENWTFSGADALDDQIDNATASLPVPLATYTYTVSDSVTLLINEADVDNTSTDALEFVELYDGGTGNTPLDGYVIVLYNGSDDLSYNDAIDLDGYATDENGYFVIGSESVENVDLVAFTTNGLQNGADAIALYQGDATSFPNDTAILVDDTLIDALVYGTDDDDDAGLLVLLNSGEAQVNEAGEGDKDNHSMQRIANGTGGLRNTSTYTQAFPSPGTENGAAVIAPGTITILEARNTEDGELVTISGVLTVADEFAGSAYIQDATAAIAIFDQTVHGEGNFMVGDSITLTGTRSSYSDQIQISTVVSVENNGLPATPIEVQTITLAELGDHPAELVRVVSPSFPNPGDIIFGGSNFEITDASGTGELRIDIDVEALVGLGQPDSCDEIIGVVGRFYEIYQLLPRMKSDMACAGEYVPLGSSVTISKEKTFDVAAWNIEWFGDASNSPALGYDNPDQVQKDSVKVVLQSLDADIYAVEEISDEELFATLVGEMEGYDYVLSDAVSYPDDTSGTQQKLGFIYNTATVSVVETKPLLASIHPYYNGGDESALADYPVTDKTRFYASGRLPFLMTADVTIEGVTKQFDIVALHARANSSTTTQERYDMRKYDVEILKDTLDVQYGSRNLIVMGDYNDDVDFTVASDVSSAVSTFEAYVNDPTNYNILTSVLSDNNYRSYVFSENMIDHIMVSEEVSPYYIEETVSVGYEFYDADFSTTASDHFPVFARFLLEEFKINEITATATNCDGEDATATVSVSGGVSPYSYEWSDGQLTATATDLVGGEYSVIVTDASGESLTTEITIEETTAIEITQSEDTKVYAGYGDESCATIGVTSVTGGVAPYTYAWSTGETTEEISACPEETTTYTVTVTDANGCYIESDIVVEVENVVCETKGRYTKIAMCYKGRSVCVWEYLVKYYERYGYTVGSCTDDGSGSGELIVSDVYPNPFSSYVVAKIEASERSKATFVIYNGYGRIVYKSNKTLSTGENKTVLPLWYLSRGYYYLKIYVDGDLKSTQTLMNK
ncbi:endonuclease [Cellulophaga baltica]|uniref:endonuclease n=1 Tax=Cellulophaga TaxID=104264 RepID=UPI001C07148E|nr:MULTISPECIES: endonuclease [Cellulophaga]MBU2996697.1 endonuclease [Cellulophaga baltica]MDO6768091.1 endonuclease [Cellulophaga sp. 1_MG-2023]